jgi:hypothetical protein
MFSLLALSSAASLGSEHTVGDVPAIPGDSAGAIPEFYVGDFDGDGMSDLGLFWPNHNTFDVTLSTGESFGASGSGHWIEANVFGHRDGRYLVGDYNGDDKSDLGFFEPADNSFHVNISTGHSFDGSRTGRWIDPGEFGHRGGQYYVGLFNGGRKADLGFYEPANNSFHVTLSTGGGFNGLNSGQWLPPNVFGHPRGRFRIGDYNKDGSQDLGFFDPDDNSFHIAFSDGTRFDPNSQEWISPNEFGHRDGEYYVGDYNKDRRADLGFFEPADNSFHVTLSTGGRFDGPGSGAWVEPNQFGHRDGQYTVGDYDGDGRSDLGFFDPADNSFHVSLSTGTEFNVAGSGVWARFNPPRLYVPLARGNR